MKLNAGSLPRWKLRENYSPSGFPTVSGTPFYHSFQLVSYSCLFSESPPGCGWLGIWGHSGLYPPSSVWKINDEGIAYLENIPWKLMFMVSNVTVGKTMRGIERTTDSDWIMQSVSPPLVGKYKGNRRHSPTGGGLARTYSRPRTKMPSTHWKWFNE